MIRCDSREELERYLTAHGIGTVKHYPVPIHMQKAYSDLNLTEGSYPIAEKISRTVLSIPLFYGMSDAEIDYVIQFLNAYHG